ncbi:hypothetical protein F5J12DRAFT_434446 [Pisolithus orientalis]|uniref:uncharacterized protein n=1 Tax=Pisolithus orientalis TaxID=936130 RepID=UPI002224AB4A|nr:uncharacterized protein F5J12DRAFT_434446 [Pisolithus orientalis]KAI5993107.1 hypothetical protein F5J12DRAFT_434446 [Pisolithus orientalis]
MLGKWLWMDVRSSFAAPEDDKKHKPEDEEFSCLSIVANLLRIYAERSWAEMVVDLEALPPSIQGLQQPNSTTNAAPTNRTVVDTLLAYRSLGTFMTLQIPRVSLTTGVGRGAGRNSFGGQSSSSIALGGPQRVCVEPKWKVTDIVVPTLDEKEEGEMEGDLGTVVPRVTPQKVKLEE